MSEVFNQNQGKKTMVIPAQAGTLYGANISQMASRLSQPHLLTALGPDSIGFELGQNQ